VWESESTVKHLLHRLTRIHCQGELPNVAIFSSARSGSSWLMELIATQPRFKYVNEPLHPDHLVACNIAQPPASLVWNLLLPHENRKKVLKSYIQSIEENRIHIGEPRFMSDCYRLLTNRIVFKILRAKDLIGWFQDVFGWQVIFLIRHPLATNLSRKQFPRLDLFLNNEQFVSKFLTTEQFKFSRQIQSHGTQLQIGVLDWCLQNLPALKDLENHNWLLMHYEDLISQPITEINRLVNSLNLSHPELISQRLTKASGSTAQSDRSTRDAFNSLATKPSSNFLLTKWREKLTPSDEENAFQILDAFQIEMYCRGSNSPVRRVPPFSCDGSVI